MVLAVLHIMFLILYYFCPFQFIVFFNLVSIRVNGQQYLHCSTYAHFTRVILKGPMLQIIVFDVCVSSFFFSFLIFVYGFILWILLEKGFMRQVLKCAFVPDSSIVLRDYRTLKSLCGYRTLKFLCGYKTLKSPCGYRTLKSPCGYRTLKSLCGYRTLKIPVWLQDIKIQLLINSLVCLIQFGSCIFSKGTPKIIG